MCLSAGYSQMQQMNSGDLQIAVRQLGELGSVLYIAAHPDDENTALLSYFTKEKYYRTAYLSVTRGEGGQNLIGSDLGARLGVIRTQELLAARRIDGAEQFFTRAVDFGYSKSADETLQLWNKDSVLKDIVWVIRMFRPDVIITRFSRTQGGHGQHLASAILAEEAFALSGDPNVFPEQLPYAAPWKAKRLLFNHFRFGGVSSKQNNVPTISVDVGTYNPFLGRSYNEIAGISRSMHKSQGMGSPLNRGSSINEFVVTAGEPARSDLFEGIDHSWKRIPHGAAIDAMMKKIISSFDPAAPEKSIPRLLELYKALRLINNDPLVNRKMKEIEAIILSCAGAHFEAVARRPICQPNDSVHFVLSFLNRSSADISVQSIFSEPLSLSAELRQPLRKNQAFTMQMSAKIPDKSAYSQPYWLFAQPTQYMYSVADQSMIGTAENPPSLSLNVTITVNNLTLMLSVPVVHKRIDDLDGEKIRNVEILPPVSVSLQYNNIVWSDTATKTVTVRLRSFRSNIVARVFLNQTEGWIVSSPQNVTLTEEGSETELNFPVKPDKNARSADFAAVAEIDGKIYSSDVRHLDHSHIPPQPFISEAAGKFLTFDVRKKGSAVGYIMGAGDGVPDALKQIGYTVHTLSDEELTAGTFMHYDAIIAGVRSYNTREHLRRSHPMLMKYVEKGGTYIVQYQTMERGQTDNLGPLRLSISRNRVTDENAPVTILSPDHPLVLGPNVITAEDFKGWIQERGLYFANEWDSSYSSIISCADPNEEQQRGGLLHLKHGKGNFIFTGLSLFRQLPAGVEGAYRLLANMVSIGK